MTQAGQDPRPIRLGLLGIPVSSRNQGVQALAASVVNLCTSSASGTQVILLAGHDRREKLIFRTTAGEVTVPVVNFRMSPKSRPCDHLLWITAMAVLYRCLPLPALRGSISRATPFIAALETCDLAADIRGGDSFSDIYGLKRFAIGFLAAWSAILVKGALVQLPQTYGPFKSPLARWMARFLLRRSAIIVARDQTSHGIAMDLASPNQRILLSPDVAFSLSASLPAGIPVDPPACGMPGRPSIGLNVNGLMFHGGYSRDNMFGLKMDYPAYLKQLLLALLEEQDGEIWLIPHTYAGKGDVESDLDASEELRAALPREYSGRVRIVTGEYGPHEVKGVIGMCGFFIGSRMHSCIAALSQGIPCVGVAYSMKFHGVFESVGMEEWVVEARESETGQAVRRTLELFRQREEIRGRLKIRADDARVRLDEIFAGLGEYAAGGQPGKPMKP
jgi:polysaccharide pyruvyl transferase WcaK-like protein